MNTTDQASRERKQQLQRQKDIMGFIGFLIMMGSIFWFFAPDDVRQAIYVTLFGTSDSGLASLTVK